MTRKMRRKTPLHFERFCRKKYFGRNESRKRLSPSGYKDQCAKKETRDVPHPQGDEEKKDDDRKKEKGKGKKKDKAMKKA